jgi:DNA primase
VGYVFPDSFIAEVRAANSIFDVVSEHIPLKKSGASYKGHCPFHSEKTPSFHVHPEKEIFHCFGCGVGGDVFGFVQKFENVSFPKAVEMLAGRRGIPLPAVSARELEEDRQKRRILEANEAAALFYQAILRGPVGVQARTYLEGRGITPATAETFRLGWSPPGWDELKQHLRKKGFPEEILLKAGLTVARQDRPGSNDRFRSRVIFPISSPTGEVVAFGGRATEAGREPKYLNSPETPLFHKAGTLYGLHQARGAIRNTGYAVVVEGYLDLITCHQAGIGQVVATLGTALGRDHLRLLRRHTGTVVMLYDGDAAGLEAMTRSLEPFLQEDLAVRAVLLPPGHDPDSFVRHQGGEALGRLLETGVPLMEFVLERIAQTHRPGGIDGKARAAAAMAPLLGKVAGRIRRDEYVRFAARLLDVREDLLLADVERSPPPARVREASPPPPSPTERHPLEEELVRAMLLSPRLAADVREQVPLSRLRNARCRDIADALYHDAGEPGATGATVISLLANRGNSAAADLAAALLAEERPAEDLERVIRDCLRKYHHQQLSSELKDLQDEIRQAEAANRPELDALLKRKQAIARA